jgi:GDP-L-fucose synthase
MNRNARVFVAGHQGLVGSALVRRLRASGFQNLLLCSRRDADLTCQDAVRCLFERERPEYVLLAAARVGGILANSTYPAEFIQQNLLIQANVIDAAYRSGVRKLLALGSSCIYPKFAAQPMRKESLLTGPLEPTNEWYAIAKIAGLKMCQAYRRQHGVHAIAAMPTNIYCPEDRFHLRKFSRTSRAAAEGTRRKVKRRIRGCPLGKPWVGGPPSHWRPEFARPIPGFLKNRNRISD